MRSNTVIPAPVARVERGIGTRPGPTASFKKEMLSVRSLNAKALHSVEPSVGIFVVGADLPRKGTSKWSRQHDVSGETGAHPFPL